MKGAFILTTAEKLFSEAAALDKEGYAEKAATLYMGAAELGYVPAQLNIGVAYLFGRGVAQDYSAAVLWLQQAASQNNASAISNLAYCYKNGYGVERDEAKAMELYGKAANLGDTTASGQYELLSGKHAAQTPPAPRRRRPVQPASDHHEEEAKVSEVINQIFGAENRSVPTVNAEVCLVGDQTATTRVSVYVPEFGRNVRVDIPNSIEQGQSITLSEGANAALNGVKSPLNVRVTKVTCMEAPKASPAESETSETEPMPEVKADADLRKKVSALKRRVYTKPLISLFFSMYFILSVAGMFIMMNLYPDGGAPEMLMNIIGCGFSLGFLPVFYFKFLPYLIGRYPAPGFFKIRKVMKNLKKRNLLEKAVAEMETCRLVAFGDKMVLSDSFLFPRKKNGIIIPCDELLWVYVDYSHRRGRGYIMLGTEKLGIECFSCIRRSKQYEQVAAATISALQRRNPAILVGWTRENKKKYSQLIKKK